MGTPQPPEDDDERESAVGESGGGDASDGDAGELSGAAARPARSGTRAVLRRPKKRATGGTCRPRSRPRGFTPGSVRSAMRPESGGGTRPVRWIRSCRTCRRRWPAAAGATGQSWFWSW